jgi:20S proteasome alpha/beta subunit
MTTLIGIKASKGEQGVILASDMSRTQTRWTPQGDVAYRQQKRTEGQKIYINDAGTAAMCMSGVYDQPYVDFLSQFLEGEFNLEKVLEKGFFPELLNLNLKRWGGRVPNTDACNALLIATRLGKESTPMLHTCYPLGAIEERSWTSIGSGSEYALEYLSESGKLVPKRIDVEQGIDLTVKALDKASQDLYTGGIDLIVVRPEGIEDFGEQIRKEVDAARQKAIAKAKASLRKGKK